MSSEEGSVPVPGGGSLSKQPNFRREWDKEAFEAKAKARLAEEESLEEERERKKTAPAPIVQRAPLQRRTEELRLEKLEGSRQLVTGAQAQAGSFSAAYHCKVCDCVLRDSANYLLHINGRKHNRMLGMSMRAERSTLEEVKVRAFARAGARALLARAWWSARGRHPPQPLPPHHLVKDLTMPGPDPRRALTPTARSATAAPPPRRRPELRAGTVRARRRRVCATRAIGDGRAEGGGVPRRL